MWTTYLQNLTLLSLKIADVFTPGGLGEEIKCEFLSTFALRMIVAFFFCLRTARPPGICVSSRLACTHTKRTRCSTPASSIPANVRWFIDNTRDKFIQNVHILLRVALYEGMTRFVLPLCTDLPHPAASTPISSVTTIIDLQDVSLGSMWTLRNHLQQASTLATANYPETLNNIAVVGAPNFFPTIWGWIKVRFY